MYMYGLIDISMYSYCSSVVVLTMEVNIDLEAAHYPVVEFKVG